VDPVDVVAIHQLYGLYGHVMDDRDWDRLSDLFSEDCVFDATALGIPLMKGHDAIAAATESSPAAPLAHHVTNVYVADIDGDIATVRAKALGTYAHGRAFSGDYEDTLVRTPAGWRIRSRLNRPSRAATR
jgi:3-phenylpropionate/cinnamic acid dioxygenase small subunit